MAQVNHQGGLLAEPLSNSKFTPIHQLMRPILLSASILATLLTHSIATELPSRVWDITTMGAIADPAINSTAAIQKSIDAAHSAGGGTVIFPPGKYRSGTLELKSGVRIELEAGATLLASRNAQDYDATGMDNTPVLIRANKANHIAITGRGTIDGQAQQVWGEPDGVDGFIAGETEIARKAGIDMKRPLTVKPNPCLIYFTDCEDVLIENASFINSAFWSVHLGTCHRVTVRSARIESSLEMGVNADGLDIDSCRDVRVTGCTISTGDDAICLKTTRKAAGLPCEDVVVTGCTLVSTSCALKLGTESYGDFRRIIFSDCIIRNSNRGIGIFVRDGATVSDVLFSNLIIDCNRKHYNWWGDGDPIHFVVLKRNAESRLGLIRNVVISNVIARGQGTSLISGFPGGKGTEAITLRNVHFTMEKEATADKRATHGLVLRDLKNVTLDDVRVSWDLSKGAEVKWSKALDHERIVVLRQSNCVFEDPPK